MDYQRFELRNVLLSIQVISKLYRFGKLIAKCLRNFRSFEIHLNGVHNIRPIPFSAWLNSSVPESAWGFIFMDSTASFVAISSGVRGLLCSLALQPTLHAMNNIIVMRPEFFTKLFKPGSSSNFILVVYQAEVYFSIKPIIFIRLRRNMLPIPFIRLIFDL